MNKSRVVDYIDVEMINLDIKAKTKRDIIKELLESIKESKKIVDYDKCLSDLYAREELGTTGIGKNVALPHAKTEGVTDLLIGIGVSKNGINYNSIDEEDAKIFFMFLSPSGETQEYLKILARISRLIRENDFRTKIINAKTTSELLDVIEKAEK